MISGSHGNWLLARVCPIFGITEKFSLYWMPPEDLDVLMLGQCNVRSDHVCTIAGGNFGWPMPACPRAPLSMENLVLFLFHIQHFCGSTIWTWCGRSILVLVVVIPFLPNSPARKETWEKRSKICIFLFISLPSWLTYFFSYPDNSLSKDFSFLSNIRTSNDMQNQRCSLECGKFAGNRMVVAKSKKLPQEARKMQGRQHK